MLYSLRAFLTVSLTWLSIALFAPILIVVGMVLPVRKRIRLVRVWVRFVNRLWFVLADLDYQVSGMEKMPQAPYLILSKHQSIWETFVLQLLFPPYVWVLKKELLKVPFFGWGLGMLRPLALDRGSGQVAINQILRQGKQRLDSGLSVLIFPEGTRLLPGRSRRHGVGGAALAKFSGHLIVPVAHNAGSFWPTRSRMTRPGTVEIVIGDPIDPGDMCESEISQRVKSWMDEHTDRLEESPKYR